MKTHCSFAQFVAFVFGFCVLFLTVHNGIVLRGLVQEMNIFRDAVNRDHNEALARLKNVENFIDAQVQARIELSTTR